MPHSDKKINSAQKKDSVWVSYFLVCFICEQPKTTHSLEERNTSAG